MSLVTLFFPSLFYTQASNFCTVQVIKLVNHSTWTVDTLIQIIGYSRLEIQKIPTLENKTLEGL